MDGPWKVYFETKDYDTAYYTKFVEEFSKNSRKAIWYFHPTGRDGRKGPHIHGLVFDFKYSDDTARNRIKEAFNVKGSELGLSNNHKKGEKMQEETVDRYITYMTKGQYEPVYMLGYSQEDANRYRSEWKSDNVIRVNGDLTVVTKGDVKRTRINQVAIARMVIARYNDQLKVDDADHEMKKLALLTRDILRENGMSCNYRQVANILQDIQAELNPRYWLTKILSMV